jgi:hypothetical protein
MNAMVIPRLAPDSWTVDDKLYYLPIIFINVLCMVCSELRAATCTSTNDVWFPTTVQCSLSFVNLNFSALSPTPSMHRPRSPLYPFVGQLISSLGESITKSSKCRRRSIVQRDKKVLKASRIEFQALFIRQMQATDEVK